MISYIKGKLMEKNPAYVIVETAGGVGYYINISLATFSALPNENEEVKLLTYFIVKEDAQVLYGFLEEEERELFKLLISVNGIGPNTGRLILSSMSVGEVLNAIATENVKAIQSIKGIGAKTAQRLIVELKDKTKKATWGGQTKISTTYNNNKYDALTALIALGFPKAGAESVLDKIIKAEGMNLSVEDLIKKSLKLL
ncbi:MAG: Holliday junction branch migration protein RuvA [Bacteroidales bacterium]|jgi:Holliday junction DNA helicase RuvA|nr:Holliday junction branch migration protein RuvA [Bacteroidales bacterium]MBO7586009.1 Holliday junction branch migration protein RuvA [Bacteroidales bacterium]MBO7648143.1 Holliday junction branch migration protein RuvA [Bacteroidales bacterium]MCR4858134.1 Holliday junction branch migration protein RuvA [Bacteroidales bacterium]